MLIVGGAAAPSNQAGTGTAVGTCGELVQGFTSSGRAFHVTCPIEKTSTVTLTLKPASTFSVDQLNTSLDKLELGIRKTAEYLKLEPCEVRVSRWSDLDVGKGMGSSTADIIAGARAVAAATGRTLNSAELAAIATSIESSDGTMHPGIVAFDHKKGGLLRAFKWWPQFIIVMIIPPKNLNTESADFSGKAALGPEFDEILNQLDAASSQHSAIGFAKAATRSASLNQRFVPNPYFALLEERLPLLNADGINVGHTGTVVGVLFDSSKPTATKSASAAAIEIQGMFPEARVELTLTPPYVER